MKKVAVMFMLTFIISFGVNARITYELSVRGAFAKVKFVVVDQDGEVVPGVNIWGAFSASSSKDATLIDGVTNTNGEFVVQGKCNEFLRVDVTKEGYYHTEVKINFWKSKEDPIVVDGRWQPYGETRKVVLKKIKNPIVMSTPDKSNAHGYPATEGWVGYDLEKQDWVAPNGNGILADVKIRFVTHRFDENDFARTMEVSFVDVPYGGAYLMSSDEGSELKTIYAADTNAVYVNELKYEFLRHGRKRVLRELNRGEYLVFRTRTKINLDGSLESAHYGVIMGEWKFFEPYGMSISKIIFNPTPNDTNLEDAETARKARLWHKQILEFKDDGKDSRK